MTENFVETDPAQAPPVPKAWKDLGVVSGFDPPPPEKLRIMVVGKYDAGKTTFVMSRPRNLVVSAEASAQFVSAPRANFVYPRSYQGVQNILDLLEEEKDKPGRTYDCVTIDTVDHFLPLLDETLVEEYSKRDAQGNILDASRLASITDYGIKGKGWVLLANNLTKFFRSLTHWGYSYMTVSYIIEKTITVPGGGEYIGERISLPPIILRSIVGDCDFVAGIIKESTEIIEERKKIVKVNGKDVEIIDKVRTPYDKVILAPDSSIVRDAKRRVSVPPRMEIGRLRGWDTFAQAYQEECDRLRATEN